MPTDCVGSRNDHVFRWRPRPSYNLRRVVGWCECRLSRDVAAVPRLVHPGDPRVTRVDAVQALDRVRIQHPVCSLGAHGRSISRVRLVDECVGVSVVCRSAGSRPPFVFVGLRATLFAQAPIPRTTTCTRGTVLGGLSVLTWCCLARRASQVGSARGGGVGGRRASHVQ